MISIKDPITLEIYNLLQSFIRMIKENDFKLIATYIDENVNADISIFGKLKGLKELKARLKWQGPEISHKRFLITNPVIRYKGNVAQAGFILIVILGSGSGSNLHIFSFGGRASVELKKSRDAWKIDEILFDMEWQSGNTIFAENWKLIDYSVYGGHMLSIISELDSPWARIPEADNQFTEEELLADAYHRYAWGLDCLDSGLSLTSYTEDIYADMPHGIWKNNREFTYYMKFLAVKEHKMQHSGKVHSFSINGNEAEMEVYRIEPHRLGTKVLNEQTFYNSFYTGRHLYKLRKENGMWKLKQMKFVSKTFVVEEENDSLYVNDAIEVGENR